MTLICHVSAFMQTVQLCRSCESLFEFEEVFDFRPSATSSSCSVVQCRAVPMITDILVPFSKYSYRRYSITDLNILRIPFLVKHVCMQALCFCGTSCQLTHDTATARQWCTVHAAAACEAALRAFFGCPGKGHGVVLRLGGVDLYVQGNRSSTSGCGLGSGHLVFAGN